MFFKLLCLQIKQEWPILIIFCLFLLYCIIISPVGNFPLVDDCLYSWSVLNLLETGHISFISWGSIACYTQVILGALLSMVFGFSHTLLRCLTLIFCLIATIFLYLTARELHANKKLAVLIAIIFAANPLVVNLSFSFMTEMYSAAFIILYLYLMIKFLKTQSPSYALVSSLSLILSIFCRQTNAVFVIPNLLVCLFIIPKRKSFWLLILSLVIVPVLAALSADKLLEASSINPIAYHWYKHQFYALFQAVIKSPYKQLAALVVQSGQTIMYLGLFLTPLLCCYPRRRIPLIWFLISIAIIGLTVDVLFFQQFRLMPFCVSNLIRIPEVGALTTIYPLEKVGRSAVYLRFYVTCFAIFCGFLILNFLTAGSHKIIVAALRKFFADKKSLSCFDRLSFFILMCFGTSFFCIVLQTMAVSIDRYYVMLLPTTLLLIVLAWQWLHIRPIWVLIVPSLLAMSFYSIFATQDYLSFNRARYSLLAKLEAQGVKSNDIDGGYEYNYFKHPWLGNVPAETFKYGLRGTRRGQCEPLCNWRFWNVTGEKYIISSYIPMPHYEIFDQQNYWSWLFFKRMPIFVLKQISDHG